MPVPALFADVSEFPADVPIATSQTLALDRLEQGEETVSDQLYRACREHGYFLLDLRGSIKGEHLLKAAERMFDVATQTFDLGKDVLTTFAGDFPKDHRGYKYAGQFTTENGKPDGVDIYTVGRDEVTGIDLSRKKPKVLDDRRDDCEDFVRSAHEVSTVIFNVLESALDLDRGTLTSLCAIDKASPTCLRLVRSSPQIVKSLERELDRIAMAGHTDIGVMTLVFNVIGGLQILPAGCSNINENWRYVKPVAGCVLVQIGDTLVEWTGNVLRSNRHRVVNPPGPQADSVRQSLVYLSKPPYGGSMRRLTGGRIIPPLGPGEEEEKLSSDEWAAWRTKQIMTGGFNPPSRGVTVV